MRHDPFKDEAGVTVVAGTGAAGAAEIATIAALANDVHVVRQIDCSVDAAPTNDMTLTVEIDSVTVWTQAVYIAADADAPPRQFFFPHGLYGEKNQAVVVTLSAIGGADNGLLNVHYQ